MGVATGPLAGAGLACAGEPELLWAFEGPAGSKEATAAAKMNQIGNKRGFLVIILGISFLLPVPSANNLMPIGGTGSWLAATCLLYRRF